MSDRDLPHCDSADEANDSTFGERVRAARLAHGISLRAFASIIDISPTYLSKIERGELPPPATERIFSIASNLHENVDELFGLAGKIAPDVLETVLSHPVEYAALVRKLRFSTRSKLLDVIELLDE